MPGIEITRVVHGDQLESQLKELVCSICLDLVEPNKSCQIPCGHIFCTSCILHSIESTGPNCPLDKSPIGIDAVRPLKDVNPMVYRMLGRIEVKCENFQEGCPWVEALSEANSHQQTCAYRSKHCKCCASKGLDLERALKLITAYEGLTKEYDTKVNNLQQHIDEHYKKLVEEQERKIAFLEGQLEKGVKFSSLQMSDPPSVKTSVERKHQTAPDHSQSTAVKQPIKSPRLSPLRSPRKRFPEPWKGGILLATLQGHTERVNSIAATPDGIVYTGGWDGVIQMWKNQLSVATIDAHKGSVNKLLVGSDGYVYSCGDDKAIKAWKGSKCAADLEAEGNVFGNYNPVKMAWSGETLFVGYYKGGIAVYEQFKKVAVVREHGLGSSYMDIVASPDKTVYFSGNLDKSIVAYKGGAVVANLDGHTGDVYSMAVSPEGILYSLSVDDTIRVWKNYQCIGVLNGLKAQGEIILGNDGVLYSGSSIETVVRAWRGNECLAMLQGHQATVTSVALSPDGLLYSGDLRGQIKVWQGSG